MFVCYVRLLFVKFLSRTNLNCLRLIFVPKHGTFSKIFIISPHDSCNKISWLQNVLKTIKEILCFVHGPVKFKTHLFLLCRYTV
jgi:hypothetical protein